MKQVQTDDVKESVKKRYGEIAQRGESPCGCMISRCCSGPAAASEPSSSSGFCYSDEQVRAVPVGADLGLGCGNPQTIAGLQLGETVLDLGSGAGVDSFLAARQVGKSGRVIGVDMTPEMVAKAQELAGAAPDANVEFRLGDIENLPVPDASVDVIISNCVINLSPDKRRVYREAFRVLKPKGRLAISDTVALVPLPDHVRSDLALHSRCLAGALTVAELEAILQESGFEKIRIQLNDKGGSSIREWVPGTKVEDCIRSALIQAEKREPCRECQC